MRDRKSEYWHRNLRYLGALLSVWFVVSYGFGILLANTLDSVRLGGFKLGFWFAQQGSIYVFVILIFVYVRLMNRLDREFDVHEEKIPPTDSSVEGPQRNPTSVTLGPGDAQP